jgi:hypothetical protein
MKTKYLVSQKLYLVSLLALLCSCATVFSPGHDSLTFTSEPAGAEVFIDGQRAGATPLTLRMDRQTFHTARVTVRADGYEPRVFPLSKSLNKVAIFNLTFWPSWITDALSGSMIEYAPDSYYIELNPRPSSKNSRAEVQATQQQLSRSLRRERTRYLLNHYQPIIKEIAQGQGQHLRDHWKLLEREDLPFEDYLEMIQENSEHLLKHQSPIDLSRRLDEMTKKASL